MNYWLLKSEPNEFSIDDLKEMAPEAEHWDGVRNYQARNFMRNDMAVGDLAFFYHSNCKEIGIVGTMEVVSEAYPDHTAFDHNDKHYDPKSDPNDPRWFMVDFRFVEKFDHVLTLDELKQNPALADLPLVRRGNRLSIMPVTEEQWQAIMAMR